VIEHLSKFMSRTVYVRVTRDKIRVRSLDSGTEVEVSPASPFSSTRLLVGNFTAAEAALKEGLRKAVGGGWFRPSPIIVIQPLEMIDGGLSEIEERVLHELAIGAGAFKVVVWVGPQLSDAEVMEKVGIARPT
jgi:hypothetical protein